MICDMNILVDKLVVTLNSNDLQEQQHISKEITEIDLAINRKLADLLLMYKNMINCYNHNRAWDKNKKYTNEYEYIYSSSSCENNVSSYVPVSRSFFKMWEILHDFQQAMFPTKTPLRFMFLCEGPGGFAEAVMKYRKEPNDTYFGMTLRCDNNRSIPSWKIDNSKLNILYGADGTGNIYHIENIKYLTKLTQGNNNKIDFITADGGFDFSSDFNNQEDMCLRLIVAEILTAMSIQKEGGHLVLKVFDIFNENTLKLVHMLLDVYATIHIVKPCTSRPANSEKYLVCLSFKGSDNPKLKQHVDCLEEYIKNSSKNFCVPHIVTFNTQIINKIVRYNTYAVMNQIKYIQKTLDLIRDPQMKFTISEKNPIICHQWCQKYGVSHENDVVSSFNDSG